MNARLAAFVFVLVALTCVNWLWPEAEPSGGSSTFDKTGVGHAALFELLAELDAGGGRSFEAPQRLATEAPLWIVDPTGVCDSRIASQGQVDVLDPESVRWPGIEWIRAGGVAVVFLQAADPGGEPDVAQRQLVGCDSIVGAALPARKLLGVQRVLARGELRGGVAERQAASTGAGSGDERAWASGVRVVGPLVATARRLPLAGVFAFEEALDWEVLAEVHMGAALVGGPFALTRPEGLGRIVAIADSGFTHNRWLDGADSAPLALDLVRAFGAPRFDEREHGHVPETGTLRFIAASEAMPVFAGVLVLALLYAWWGATDPPRSAGEALAGVPTLESFVSSMAALYAKTRDHDRVLERYRALSAARLERHFGLPPGLPLQALAERIRRSHRVDEQRLAQLVGGTVSKGGAKNRAELLRAARELDLLVGEISR